MKKILLLLAMLGLSGLAQSQVMFQKVYSDSAGNDMAPWHMTETFDSGYAICGRGSYFDAYDAMLMKVDASGQFLWAKTYGTADMDLALCVKQLPDSGFILTGFSDSTNPGQEHVLLLRTDPLGNLLWTKRITFPGGSSEGFNIIPLNNGYIITGQRSTGRLIMRTDTAGNPVWAKMLGLSGNPYYAGTSLMTADSSILLVAKTTGIYLGKFDLDGNFFWQKNYDVTGSTGFSLRLTGNGDIIVSGQRGTGMHMVMRTDSGGVPIWAKQFAPSFMNLEPNYEVLQGLDERIFLLGNYFDGSYSRVQLIQLSDSGTVNWTHDYGMPGLNWGITGGMYYVQHPNEGPLLLTHTDGDHTVYLVRTDTAGFSGCNEYVNSKNLTSYTISSVAYTPSVIVQNPYVTVPPVQTHTNVPQELSLCPLAATTVTKPEQAISIAPVPLTDISYLRSSKAIRALTVYAADGRVLRTENNPGLPCQFTRSEFKPGLYICRVLFADGSCAVTKFTVQ